MKKNSLMVPVLFSVGILAVAIDGALGCASSQQTAKTIDNAAVILCDVFFAEQKPAMSIADIEKAFCATATDIAPFLASARTAARAGGAAREASKP